MTYVELDLNDGLYEKLEKLSSEEGISVEELINDILEDEVDFADDEEEVEDEDDCSDICVDTDSDFEN